MLPRQHSVATFNVAGNTRELQNTQLCRYVRRYLEDPGSCRAKLWDTSKGSLFEPLSSELSFDQKYFHLFEYQTWAIYFWASITELWLVSTNFSFECKTRANLRTKKKLIEYNAYSCIANNAYKQQQTLVVLPKSGLLADHAINKFTDKYSENHFQWQQGWSIPMPDPFQK